MGSFNRAIVIGNLGRDAEVRYTQGGAAVANFSLATTDQWTDKDGQKQERTEWHKVVLWGKEAESLKDYLLKGKQVCVEGSLQTRKWQDKDGNDKYTTEIKAHRVVLLGGGPRRERAEDGGSKEVEVAAEPERQLVDDDIPFAWLGPVLLPLSAVVLKGLA